MKRLLLVLPLAAAAYLAWAMRSPFAGFGQETFVDIPKGSSAPRIAAALRHAGVIRSEWAFLAARAIARGRKLQAGEYRFTRPASVFEVYDRIARGDIFYYELVVPEGKNIFDIAGIVEELGLFPAQRFLEAARDPAMIRDLDPRAPTLEGYLFPNTYRLSRHITPAKLCQTMTGKFREVWRGLHNGADLHDTVTLASLIEKESKLPAERPQIAAVFLKRLQIGMKLDCDPTVIYAALLENRYRGSIYKSDLDRENPYNTYRRAGLPPGPIGNPGVASIKAALQPAAGDALYFVLKPDGSGGHTFSSTMAEQEAAVAKYRHALQHK